MLLFAVENLFPPYLELVSEISVQEARRSALGRVEINEAIIECDCASHDDETRQNRERNLAVLLCTMYTPSLDPSSRRKSKLLSGRTYL